MNGTISTFVMQKQARFLTGTALAALFMSLASPGSAQTEPLGGEAAGSTIIVTGSRVIRDGLSAPTPLTTLDRDQLLDSAPQSLVTAIAQLPVAANSSSASTVNVVTGSGTAGSSFINLRNIGTARTLVLLDGRRSVPSGLTAAPDIGLFPSTLVKRVDIVTGGASAAYGSDAVSGVVNFILDTDYEGVRADAQAGINGSGNKANHKFSITAGHAFGRVHIIGAAEYSRDEGLLHSDSDFARRGYALISNPAISVNNPASPTNPARIVAADVRTSNASYGGVITTNGPLRGIDFGPGGVTRPFVFGSLASGTTMSGGSGVNGSEDGVYLSTPLTRKSAFLHADFDISDAFVPFIEGAYLTNKSVFNSYSNFETGGTAFNIYSNNYYLPDAVRETMIQNNIASFSLGRISRDFGPIEFTSKNVTKRIVAGANGNLGGGWSYSGYYTWGENRYDGITRNSVIQKNLYRAADAVFDPVSQQVMCKSKLDNPTSTDPAIAGCVPINLFGEGSPSAGAMDYVLGTSATRRVTRQQVAAADMRGTPFATWAGDLSIAFGVEYRKESARQVSDAISTSTITAAGVRGMPASLNNKLGGFERSNLQPISGSFNVKEGFIEALVPLAKGKTLFEDLTVDLAARYAKYSTSGGVTTWKVGINYQPFEDVRLRGTRSRDIRAGNIAELFTATSAAQATVIDRQNNSATVNVITLTRGNPTLKPERADTTTAGIIYRPSWLPGFGASFDFYKIKIGGAITTVPQQTIVDQCFAGDATFCALLERDANGALVRINSQQLNAAQLRTKGFDIEGSYRTTIGAGALSVRALATRIIQLETQTVGGAAIDRAGDISNNNPNWVGSIAATYVNGRWTLFAQERYIGTGRYDNTLGPNDISAADNHIPARFYTDVTTRVRVGSSENIELFFTVNNLFNQTPPKSGRFFIQGTLPIGAGSLYDLVGRSFTTGIRTKF